MSPLTDLFRITREDQLPHLGPIRETLHFDMKAIRGAGQLDKEMAKDVAAFANTEGGVVLVGAEEKERALVAYTPVLRDEAHAIVDSYLRAIRVHCSPSPVIDPRILNKDDGCVVAINVTAYSAPPVGVNSEKSKYAWTFPV